MLCVADKSESCACFSPSSCCCSWSAGLTCGHLRGHPDLFPSYVTVGRSAILGASATCAAQLVMEIKSQLAINVLGWKGRVISCIVWSSLLFMDLLGMSRHGRWTIWMETSPTTRWRICSTQHKARTSATPATADQGKLGVTGGQWCGELLAPQDGQLAHPSNQQRNSWVWAKVFCGGFSMDEGRLKTMSLNLPRLQA